jgi:glycosyltransferase involved in cell wall biosynthesis
MPATAQQCSCDLLHFPADTGPLLRLRQIPVVVTLHGVAQLHEPDVRSAAAARAWLERAKRAIRCADAIVTDSNSSREDVLELLGRRANAIPVSAIPLGVDLKRFYPATLDEMAFARDSNAIDRPFVLYLGNLEPRKNLVSLVEAIDLLNGQGYDLELLVGGKPAWDYQATLAAIDASPNARRLGWLADNEVRALMSACSVFAFPSRYEGFGLPVLEAMACGAPVMCTSRGSLPEVAGDVASYSEDIDAASLADAILEASAKDRDQAASDGVQRAQRFSWDECAAKHHALFKKVL